MNRSSLSGPPVEQRIATLSGETLVELLDLAAARTPKSVALVIRRGMIDERWTYAQLAAGSDRVARRLTSAGLRHGDRVLTWSPNDPWLVAAYFAIWRLGAVVVPLDLRMQPDVAARIGARARASLVLAASEIDPGPVAALGLPVISVDRVGLDLEPGPEPGRESGSEPGRESGSEPGRESAPGASLVLPRVSPADTAEILFTSGTTSDPKGVVLTHGQIVHTVRAIAQTGMGSRPDRALALIPLSHMYGQTVPLLMGLLSGSTLVFLHALTPKAVGAAMQRERITALTLAPHLIDILLKGIEAEARRRGHELRLRRGRRLARWVPFRMRRLLFRSVLLPLGGALEVITSGGAHLPEELQMAWEAMGVRVVQGYGTTECAAICGHTRAHRRPGTVGRPLAGLDIAIEPDGELIVRGRNVMSGYWEAPEATAEVLDADGWFHTGDAARIEASGEVRILGRTRDRISLPNGLNVYPDDVEAALLSSGSLRAAVVFEPSPGQLAAAIVPADGGVQDVALAAVVREANHRLAPHQRVGAWRRWPDDDFPRTHTLKIRRQPVIAWYLQGQPGATEPASSAGASRQGRRLRAGGSEGLSPAHGGVAPASVGGPAITAEAIGALISALLSEMRGGEPPEITPRSQVSSLDLDSLAAVSVALRIDEAFDAQLSENDVLDAGDIDALAELVRRRQGQPPLPPPSYWAYSRPARLLRRIMDATLVSWAFAIVARPLRVEGIQHLDGLEGPVLVCPNHTSHLDAPVVRLALPARLRDRAAIAAAADVWFDGGPLGRATALALGAFPFGRTADIRASLERVADLVDRGFSVILFPEGTRSADGRMLPMREGIGLLATSLRVPVIPAHIEGAHEILPKGARWPRRRAGRGIEVRFGAPILVDEAASIRDVTAQVGEAIGALGREVARERQAGHSLTDTGPEPD